MTEDVVGIRIELLCTHPKIWCRVQLPTYVSLTTLHEVIQTAFEWDGDHLSVFVIDRIQYPTPSFGGTEEEMARCSDNVRLDDVIEFGVKRFGYIYDLGATWEHMITLGKVRTINDPMTSPKLLAGEIRPSPEEEGGAFGNYDGLEELEDSGDEQSLTRQTNLVHREFDHESISMQFSQIVLE